MSGWSEARCWIWQRETALHGPYEEDEWHCDCIKQECLRREREDRRLIGMRVGDLAR
jgi:hypothetical protein